MKAYRFEGDSRLQIVQDQPYEATIEDFFVWADDRGKGLGQKLMRATCRDADREEVTLYLKPMPFASYDIEKEELQPPTMTYEELCAFYRTFGFRFRRKPFNDQMMRTPKER